MLIRDSVAKNQEDPPINLMTSSSTLLGLMVAPSSMHQIVFALARSFPVFVLMM
jgi:hypothetical protein